MKGMPRYAACAHHTAWAVSVVEYMNVKASNQIAAATDSARNALVTRETRRRMTLPPHTSIKSAVTAVGIADGDRPCCRMSCTVFADPGTLYFLIIAQNCRVTRVTLTPALSLRERGGPAERDRVRTAPRPPLPQCIRMPPTADRPTPFA